MESFDAAMWIVFVISNLIIDASFLQGVQLNVSETGLVFST